uniref:protein-tyrosine-phosphatase n=1 Tax=Magallana gigas TaxID=29159 RepID=A0A8W8NSA3_MAGGI|nr:receptor-type tyrosine-protein phosphatase epsilon-like isoform X2 [Crassostrea gigas]
MDRLQVTSLLLTAILQALTYDPLVIPNITQANLSSTYQDYVASRAVDGRPDLLNMIAEDSCTHTDVGQTSAWLRVDLGAEYSVYRVMIWYRNDRGVVTNTVRLQGYSVRVSNDTLSIPPNVCFQHDGTSQIPVVTTNDCPRIARYVWLYNEGRSPETILEICEVQIYGCELNHYGENCTSCGIGCEVCDITSGCTKCLSGHVFPACECPPGWYSIGCTEACSLNCFLSVCHIETGECSSGCNAGYLGDFCNETVLLPPIEVSGGSIAGSVVGVLFAAIVVAVVIVLIMRFRRKLTPEYRDFVYQRSLKIKREGTNSSADLVNDLSEEQSSRQSNLVKRDTSLYSNTPRQSYFLTSKEIRVKDISNVLKVKSRDSYRIFLDEFKNIPYGEESHIACTVAKETHNKPRNRFKTTFPYDHSRVVLRSGENDYINANYIQDYDGNKRYIASQGPKSNTLVDHWLMIWQEEVSLIVMLTNRIEGGKTKCEQYWPDLGTEVTYGDIIVRLQNEKHYACYVIRQMEVHHKSKAASRVVTQMHYTHWPDHGVPDPLDLVTFYRHVARVIDKQKDHGLLLVHCSAGIGRTGTFIALDSMYHCGRTHGSFNPVDFVKTMRKDRMSMIQNVDQYVFLHFALKACFMWEDRTKSKCTFTEEQINHKAAVLKMAQEFNELISIKQSYSEADKSAGVSHKELNYTPSVLPVDKYKVGLTSYVDGRSEYYNAVFLRSFCENQALIAAQYPLEGQALDFLRLLTDHESNVLVSISPLKDIRSTKEWFPAAAPLTVSTYTVSLIKSEFITPSIRRSDIQIRYDESEAHLVQVYELTTWKFNDTIPRDLQMSMDVISHVNTGRVEKEIVSPITIVSKDGAVGCGVFCAVYNAVQQIQQDAEVDMFTIVRQLQVRRPEMISTVEEYHACHKIIVMTLERCSEEFGSKPLNTGPTEGELYSNVENVYANS